MHSGRHDQRYDPGSPVLCISDKPDRWELLDAGHYKQHWALASNPNDASVVKFRGVWYGTPTNNLCVWIECLTNTDQVVLSHTAAWSNMVAQVVSNSALPVIQNISNGLASSFSQQFTSLSNSVNGLASNQTTAPRIILPNEMTAVVGDTLQVFLRGIVEAQNPYALPTEMICSVGSSYPRYFELTPTASQVGNYPLTVHVLDNQGLTLNSATTTLRVVSAVAPSQHLNVLCIGDSLTSGGQWPQEFYRRLTQNGGSPAGLGYGNITFIGDSPILAYSGQSYVGYGGWTWDRFMGVYSNTAAWVTATNVLNATDQKALYEDVSNQLWQVETLTSTNVKFNAYSTISQVMPPPPNTLTWSSGGTHTSPINYTAVAPDVATPFWNGTNFSFAGFCAANGYSGVDVIYVLLGWNAIAGPNASDPTNHVAAIASAQKFIDQLHNDYPNAKVRLMGLEVPSPTGGLGANYGASGSYANYYKLLRSVNGLRLAYQQLAASATYSNFVGYVDIASQFDSENNMPTAMAPVNTRNTNCEPRGLNGVHPSTQGYLQIADTAYRDFIRCFCQ